MTENQKIKEGDYVYIPTYSNKALEVFENPESKNRPLRAMIKEGVFIDFYEDGISSNNHVRPIVYLATEENREKLQNFYDCELELSPVQKRLNDLHRLFDYFLPDLQEKGILVANKELSNEFAQLKAKVFALMN